MNCLELFAVGFHVAQADALAPVLVVVVSGSMVDRDIGATHPRRKGKLEVVCAERVVLDGCFDTLLE